MSKILITGSKGVIGTYLVNMLQQKHEVFGIDLTHDIGETGWEHPMSEGKSIYSRCDISDFRQLSRVFSTFGPFDFVYHTAAEFGRWNGEDFYEQVWRTNVIGTKNIIRLQEQLKFKLIHFSSSEVYGDYDGLMSEDIMEHIEIKQLNDYAMTKWVNEMQIKNSSIQYNTESVIVRIFNSYGPGEWFHPYRSVNCKLCYNAIHKIPSIIYKGHYRTSLYLDDLSQTLCKIIDNFIPGETYNIGGTEYHSIEKLADIIWELSGSSKKLISYENAEIMTTKVKKADITKAKRDLGHCETVDLVTGIKKTLEWQKLYYKV
jgi:dTDP-glucose 4,6-dehydratase